MQNYILKGFIVFLMLSFYQNVTGGGIGKIGDKTILKNVKHKILVLEYDNPEDQTWGKDISQMIAQEFLGTMNGVFNMGVVHLEQKEDSLVEYTPENILKISNQQEVLITIWGEFYVEGNDVYVYSHLRIIPREDFPEDAFGISMRLEINDSILKAGPATLQVNFKPIKLSIETLERMHDFYNKTIQIRKDPNESAEIKKALKAGDTYYVLKRENDWMKIITKNATSGWIKYQNLAEQHELNEVASVLRLGQGILQYMAGNYAVSTNTLRRYIEENSITQDHMNRCFSHILLGNSMLHHKKYTYNIPDNEQISVQYREALKAFPNNASAVNHLAIVTILKDFYKREDSYESFSAVEKLLIHAIQAENNKNAIRNLEALYIVSRKFGNLRHGQDRETYDQLIEERLELLHAIEVRQD
ncbi:MAG: hypothetical protein ABFS05_04565 [Bacteroidota bacterium]